mgnify:CR=1 FL=1
MKQHEKLDKIRKKAMALFRICRWSIFVWVRFAGHAYNGGVSASRSLHCLGGRQYPVSGCGRDQPSPYHAEAEKGANSACYVRRIYLCHIFSEDSVRDGQL